MAGQLFIIATPIGNLEDITCRAISTLRQVAIIAAEDTRTSRKLLSHYGISTPVMSCHEHNEKAASRKIMAVLRQDRDVALISDAGTPLISDPGYHLVRLLKQKGFAVSPIPGPCSPIAALSASGLPTDRFSFLGFLPRSGRARQASLASIAQAACTQILMESPRRLRHTLEDLAGICGPEREACMAREMTKLHEEIVSGSLGKLRDCLHPDRIRGELVLLIAPVQVRPVTDEEIIQSLQHPGLAGLPPSARARQVAQTTGAARARVYALLMAMDRDE